MTLLLVGVYLVTGIGLSEINLEIPGSVSEGIRSAGLPCVLFGEFQATPEEILESPWDLAGLSLLSDPSVITCLGLSPRAIDLVMITPWLRGILHPPGCSPRFGGRILRCSSTCHLGPGT